MLHSAETRAGLSLFSSLFFALNVICARYAQICYTRLDFLTMFQWIFIMFLLYAALDCVLESILVDKSGNSRTYTHTKEILPNKSERKKKLFNLTDFLYSSVPRKPLLVGLRKNFSFFFSSPSFSLWIKIKSHCCRTHSFFVCWTTFFFCCSVQFLIPEWNFRL